MSPSNNNQEADTKAPQHARVQYFIQQPDGSNAIDDRRVDVESCSALSINQTRW
jgi:hypothetical protein